MDVSERLAGLGRLTGSHVGIVTVRQERGAERAPSVIDPAGAAHVDEHKRVAVERTALTQQMSHRGVIGQAVDGLGSQRDDLRLLGRAIGPRASWVDVLAGAITTRA
jgi:hypothetical protein